MCGGASDAHAAQRIHDIAQGAGDRRVFDFEALDRQVHAVGDARVLGGSFQLDFRFDLRHQRMQILTLGSVHSHLLKSNCPVTSQPDWGSVVVEYRGAALDHASLLEYIVSFRQHSDFHEQCVERIFLDLQRLLKPEKLTVFARYVRRGGLDINPYRSTEEVQLPNHRLVRQ